MRRSARPAVAVAKKLPAPVVKWLANQQFRSAFVGHVIAQLSAPLTRADTTIGRGPGAGLAFNAAGTNPGYVLGTTEPLVQSAFAEMCRPGSIVLDVGTNVGFFAVIAARLVGSDGRVVCFEPVAGNVAALRHNLALNGFNHVDVVPLALGEDSGSGDFLVGRDPTKSRMASFGTMIAGTAIEVEIAALDDLVADGRVPAPDVIKMDIEGAEIEALRGMRETLMTHRPVVLCEMHGRTDEFVQAMDELDYEVEAIEDVPSVSQAPWWIHLLARPK